MSATTAGEVMTREVITIRNDSTIEELIGLAESRRLSGIPVTDARGRAVGMISQSDVLRSLAHLPGARTFLEEFRIDRHKASSLLLEAALDKGRGMAVSNLLNSPVEALMCSSLVSCAPETPLPTVCEAMTRRHVHRVVVLDPEGKVAGLISASDLVQLLGTVLRSA